MSNLRYITGLDLGLTQQFTALAVLEKTAPAEDEQGNRPPTQYALRHLERFSMGTPYPEVGARLVQLFGESPLTGTTLVVDLTAVGRPVLDLLRRARIKANIRPLNVTAGHRAIRSENVWLVPKQELVSLLQVLLQTRRLKFAQTMTESQTLVEELLNFKMKAPFSTDDPLAAWREGQHDDLILAAACAVWMGERGMKEFWIR